MLVLSEVSFSVIGAVTQGHKNSFCQTNSVFLKIKYHHVLETLDNVCVMNKLLFLIYHNNNLLLPAYWQSFKGKRTRQVKMMKRNAREEKSK